MSSVQKSAVYTLSEGDLKNGNIRFKQMPGIVPATVVGGTNSSKPSRELLEVTFVPGGTTKQFLYEDKMLLNNRNPHTKDFFAAIGARAGSKILVERVGPLAICISAYRGY